MRALLLAAALASLVSVPIRAMGAASDWAGDARVGIRLVTASEDVGTGPVVKAGLQIRLKPGWHTYWRRPGDAGIAPRLAWTGSENVRDVAVAWPAPVRHLQAGLRTNIYDRDVTLPLSIMLTRPGDPARLYLTIDYAGCADICIPYRATVSLVLRTGPGRPSPEEPLIADGLARAPLDLERAGLDVALASTSAAGNRRTISLLLRSRAGRFTRPTLLVEQGGSSGEGIALVAEDGRSAWLRIVPPPNRTGAPEPLVITMFDEDRVVEWSWLP